MTTVNGVVRLRRVTGSSEEIRNLNAYLKTLEQNAYETRRILIEKKLPITAANLKDYMLYGEREISKKMLLQIFKEHNRQVETLIGKDLRVP